MRRALIALALAGAVLAVFWPARRAGFVNYDDGPYVSENLRVQRGLDVDNALWALTTGEFSNWHPLTWLSYMADVELWGKGPAGFHTTNVVLHALNALLFFWLLSSLGGAPWPSAFAAALFALHPLRVESVAWIAERKDVLSGFFWLLTLLAYAAYARAPSRVRYWRVAAAFALGLMSKPMVVTLPFVLLLLDYWPLGRFDLQHRRELIIEKLPLFALSAASSLVTFLVQRRGGNVVSTEAVPFSLRLANAGISYVGYVEKTLWPSRLAVFYPFVEPPTLFKTLACAGLVVAASVLAARRARRAPHAAVGWFWFLGTLVPVIGLVQVGVQSMADRYTYIPAMGLAVLLAWSVETLSAGRSWRNAAWILLSAATLPALAVASQAQIAYWRDSRTLFARALSVEERNFLAHLNMGSALAAQGDDAGAVVHFERSLQLHPTVALTRNSLGVSLLKLGRVDQAKENFERALALEPALEEAHENLGVVSMRQGRKSEAVEHFAAAVRLKSDYQSRFNLGLALLDVGRKDEAAAQFEEALRLNPAFAPALQYLELARSKP